MKITIKELRKFLTEMGGRPVPVSQGSYRTGGDDLGGRPGTSRDDREDLEMNLDTLEKLGVVCAEFKEILKNRDLLMREANQLRGAIGVMRGSIDSVSKMLSRSGVYGRGQG